jgi:hypothetical protein
VRARFRATSAPLGGSEGYTPAAGLAGAPGSGGVARRTPVDVLSELPSGAPLAGLLVVTALIAAWQIAGPRTPDLAAAVYRIGLFHELGLAVWDEHWYAGHHLPGYSLLFPPLASLLGLRLLATLCVLASTALFERLALAVYGKGARWGAAWFAVAAVADVWIGRVAFALGVSLALAAVLAFVRGRTRLAGALTAVLAAASAAASPVAGALLVLAGVTYAVHRRSARAMLGLSAPAIAVIGLSALFVPEGGSEPYTIVSFAATVLVVVAFLWALPPDQPLLRLGALLYLFSCLLCLAVATPMGSNVERYAVLLAGPLLVCVALSEPGPERGRRLTPAITVALCISAVWVAWGPVRETLAVAGNASTSASYYAPVERFLAAHSGATTRVEVPLTRSHWETALLAPTVSLARGWEKQLDTRFDGVLLAPGLTAAAYRAWLREQAVSYVALPDTPLDPSSAQEGRLIAGGVPYLREVFASRHWRIYAVRSPTPLAAGPGRLVALGHDFFTLRADSPGRFLVRVRYSPYLSVSGGAGCVGPAPGGWTSVLVRAPGSVVVGARFSLSGALGLQSSCRAASVATPPK